MNKKIIAPAIAGVAIIIIVVAALSPTEPEIEENLETLSISYTQTNKDLQAILDMHNIPMSSPLKLNGLSIAEYCTFFSNEELQNSITYCTSTELLDAKGQFLGNIHMVGAPSNPWYVIGVIQADPITSQLADIKTVYQAMIENAVCNCWEEEKPGGFETVSDWIDAAHSHHLEAKRITSKSEISGLGQKSLLLEITTNTEGYMWTFIIPV